MSYFSRGSAGASRKSQKVNHFSSRSAGAPHQRGKQLSRSRNKTRAGGWEHHKMYLPQLYPQRSSLGPTPIGRHRTFSILEYDLNWEQICHWNSICKIWLIHLWWNFHVFCPVLLLLHPAGPALSREIFSFPALPYPVASPGTETKGVKYCPQQKRASKWPVSKNDSAEWTKSWYFAEALLALALFVQFNYQLKVLSIPLTPELKTLTLPEHLTIPLTIDSCIAQQWKCLVMVIEM